MEINKEKLEIFNTILLPKLKELNEAALKTNVVTEEDLKIAQKNYFKSKKSTFQPSNIIVGLIVLALSIFFTFPLLSRGLAVFLGIRCIIPNNYIVWEATRPITDCSYCKTIDRPLILSNVSQVNFQPLAYSMHPIIVKQAASHWPATKLLTFKFIKELYFRHPDELKRFPDECQFLSFKTNIRSLKDLLEIPEDSLINSKKPWYVGFSNCQNEILKELRKLYGIPHFLPEDAEIPNTDYIFLGYEQGAIMHLDYIPRLMWQAQLQGNKSWNLAPTPECDRHCKSFSFYVEPGDIVLIDTRVWYHSTAIMNGEFSLTIQSEYG